MTTLVFFRCGDGRYAVPVESTLGVRPPVGLVPLPRPAPGVVGLLPGDPPITVLSVLGQGAASGRGHILLLTDGTRRGGLLVDAVTQVARVPTATLAGTPYGQALELVKGVVSVGGQMVLLADVGALLGEADALGALGEADARGALGEADARAGLGGADAPGNLATAPETAGVAPPPAPGDHAAGARDHPLEEMPGLVGSPQGDDVGAEQRDVPVQADAAGQAGVAVQTDVAVQRGMT